ncbi:MAG: hypothetical protein JXR36_17460 [Bacteroidales bacterium]|jgi:hypothetical protein|nr:hypothetical protein [Bacteroidales bacterium]
MTKLIKFLQVLTLTSLILLPIHAFSQSNYSIDNEKHMKSQRTKRIKPTREERYVMKIEKATIKKEAKKKKKDYKLHKKAVRKHNKKINGGGKDLVDGKKTWRRMKKSKRESANKSK